jgi:hypothetical protein
MPTDFRHNSQLPWTYVRRCMRYIVGRLQLVKHQLKKRIKTMEGIYLEESRSPLCQLVGFESRPGDIFSETQRQSPQPGCYPGMPCLPNATSNLFSSCLKGLFLPASSFLPVVRASWAATGDRTAFIPPFEHASHISVMSGIFLLFIHTS